MYYTTAKRESCSQIKLKAVTVTIKKLSTGRAIIAHSPAHPFSLLDPIPSPFVDFLPTYSKLF